MSDVVELDAPIFANHPPAGPFRHIYVLVDRAKPNALQHALSYRRTPTDKVAVPQCLSPHTTKPLDTYKLERVALTSLTRRSLCVLCWSVAHLPITARSPQAILVKATPAGSPCTTDEVAWFARGLTLWTTFSASNPSSNELVGRLAQVGEWLSRLTPHTHSGVGSSPEFDTGLRNDAHSVAAAVTAVSVAAAPTTPRPQALDPVRMAVEAALADVWHHSSVEDLFPKPALNVGLQERDLFAELADTAVAVLTATQPCIGRPSDGPTRQNHTAATPIASVPDQGDPPPHPLVTKTAERLATPICEYRAPDMDILRRLEATSEPYIDGEPPYKWMVRVWNRQLQRRLEQLLSRTISVATRLLKSEQQIALVLSVPSSVHPTEGVAAKASEIIQLYGTDLDSGSDTALTAVIAPRCVTSWLRATLTPFQMGGTPPIVRWPSPHTSTGTTPWEWTASNPLKAARLHPLTQLPAPIELGEGFNIERIQLLNTLLQSGADPDMAISVAKQLSPDNPS